MGWKGEMESLPIYSLSDRHETNESRPRPFQFGTISTHVSNPFDDRFFYKKLLLTSKNVQESTSQPLNRLRLHSYNGVVGIKVIADTFPTLLWARLRNL